MLVSLGCVMYGGRRERTFTCEMEEESRAAVRMALPASRNQLGSRMGKGEDGKG